MTIELDTRLIVQWMPGESLCCNKQFFLYAGRNVSEFCRRFSLVCRRLETELTGTFFVSHCVFTQFLSVMHGIIIFSSKYSPSVYIYIYLVYLFHLCTALQLLQFAVCNFA